MKSYFIFAIILTAIYVVYYAANIAGTCTEREPGQDGRGSL